MNNRTPKTLGLLLLIPAALIVTVYGVWYARRPVPAVPRAVLSTQEVARHNQPTDCWTIIDDVVYDITPYVARHPGGVDITRACGIDGSDLFEKRETDSDEEVGSGTRHSHNAENLLKRYRVGELAN